MSFWDALALITGDTKAHRRKRDEAREAEASTKPDYVGRLLAVPEDIRRTMVDGEWKDP